MADKPTAGEAPKKANPQIEALKKNHFWILSAILVITGLVVWWMGTGALADQFKKDQATNDNAFSLLQPYKGAPVPNLHYKTAVEAENKKLAGGVVSTWDTLYARQAGILTMNPRVGKELGDLILLDKNERAERFKKNSQTISQALENFRNGQIIEQEFEQLFSMLNLRRPKKVAPPADGAAAVAAPAGVPEVEGVVVWGARTSTQQLMERYRTTKAPSVDRVAVTQEDIWIFKSLFGVIQKINTYSNDDWLRVLNGAELPKELPRVDQGNVPIKRIDFCDVAQYAMHRGFGDPGRLSSLSAVNSDNAIFVSSGDGGAFSVGTQGSEEEDTKLMTERYIDSRNFPVTDPAAPPISEFRQVCLQLQVLLDQRLVPVLISECAQAEFPIETRQVRMFLTEVDLPRLADAGRIDMSRVEQTPHDVTVILRGVVYIYVKPDPNKLGKGSDKEPGKRDYGIPRRNETAEETPAP